MGFLVCRDLDEYVQTLKAGRVAESDVQYVHGTYDTHFVYGAVLTSKVGGNSVKVTLLEALPNESVVGGVSLDESFEAWKKDLENEISSVGGVRLNEIKPPEEETAPEESKDLG